MSQFQTTYTGLMVGDTISMTPFGRFGSKPKVFKILSVGTDKRKENSRWIAPVTADKVQNSDKIYERDGWSIQILEH